MLTFADVYVSNAMLTFALLRELTGGRWSSGSMDKEKDTKRPVANKQQLSPAKAPPSPELRELSPRRTRYSGYLLYW